VAKYTTSVKSPLSVEEAFAAVSDVARFQEWDPGVLAGKRVKGEAPGVGTAYDLTIDGTPKQIFRYETLEFEAHKRFLMVAKTKRFTSIDEIRFAPEGTGSRITYDAELKINGVLSVLDFALKRIFNRIGDRAARGLATFLKGYIVS
jgi:Polyketide cyclase / dehydrase and lipid transport